MINKEKVHIIGGGLAGCEAAYQLAKREIPVILHEMKPHKKSPAHKSDNLAELICSNSLKSEKEDSAPYILKRELLQLDSLLIKVAHSCKVPAGHSLSVDREKFSLEITKIIERHPHISVVSKEVKEIPEKVPLIIACGPLPPPDFQKSLGELVGNDFLYFFDAISPIVDAETIDYDRSFWGARYEENSTDYLNCPLNKEEYETFVKELLRAERHPLKSFEKDIFFEACMPIEKLAERGIDTLRFGPMKPKGLVNPLDGKMPYAVVQLRRENNLTDAFNLVGFQTNLKYREQDRVFKLIPCLKNAKFTRYGQMHKNTYINAPHILKPSLEMKSREMIFFAGQISGFEGYIEAIATGLISALNVYSKLTCGKEIIFPPETALGSLQNYLKNFTGKNYQPINMTFSLFPPLKEKEKKKKERRKKIAERAWKRLNDYLNKVSLNKVS